MEQKIYFHIGLHKTATTFLQKILFPNIENLNYLKNDEILSELIQITQEDLLIYDEKKVRNSLEKYFNNSRNIISAEALSGNPFMQYMNRHDILLKIKKTFPEAKIIVGIRDQKSMIHSIYKQYLRVGGTKKSEDFFKTKDTYLNKGEVVYADASSYMNPKALLYSGYLNSIIELFGEENVLIYVFEELKINFSGFVDRFCKFFDVDKPGIENKYVNKALPDSYYPFLRFLNVFSKSNFYEKGILKIPNSFITFTSKYFPKKKVNMSGCEIAFEEFKSLYRQDNRKLEAIINKDLKEYLVKYYY